MKSVFVIGIIALLSSCSINQHYFSSSTVVSGYCVSSLCSQEDVEKALNILAINNGGILRLKRNGFYIISPKSAHVFRLPSNTIIDGNGSTFYIEGESNTDSFTWDAVFYAEDQHNITIKNLNLDSNGKNNPVLQNPLLDGGANHHNGLLSAVRTNNITIKNCTINDVKGYGCVYLGYCDDVTIKHCRFCEIGVEKGNSIISDASVIMGVGDNWVIRDNVIKNSYLSDCGTGLDLACSNSRISNNRIESFWAGANLANNGLCECHDVLLLKNHFINNNTAIFFWSSVEPFKGACYSNRIIRNRIEWKTRSGWSVRGIDLGFFVYGDVRNISIQDNIFEAKGEATPPESYEIALRIGPTERTYYSTYNNGGNVHEVYISNNAFSNCSGPAIQIERKSKDIVVEKNRIKDVSKGNAPYSTNRAIVINGFSQEIGPRNILIDNNNISVNGISDLSNNVFVGTTIERRKLMKIVVR